MIESFGLASVLIRTRLVGSRHTTRTQGMGNDQALLGFQGDVLDGGNSVAEGIESGRPLRSDHPLVSGK